MSWNYRVIVTHPVRTPDALMQTTGEAVATLSDGSVYFIHEVYYDESGVVNGWTAEPVEPMGDTLEELASTLDLMRAAVAKPVLVVSGDTLIPDAPPAPEATDG